MDGEDARGLSHHHLRILERKYQVVENGKKENCESLHASGFAVFDSRLLLPHICDAFSATFLATRNAHGCIKERRRYIFRETMEGK